MGDLTKRDELTTARNEVGSDRRTFMKEAAAVGLIGAVGIASSLDRPAAAQEAAAAEDPVIPPLKPKAFLDCRYPVTYNKSVVESTKVLIQYFEALSGRDLDGMSRTMQFPFVTYEGPYAVLVDSKDKLMATPPPSMNVTGKGDTRIRPGSYDILENIEMHIFSPVGVGYTLMYSRFDDRGNRFFQCHGIYGITNNDGKWGIEYASTIFKPDNQIGRDDYQIAAVDEALHDNHRDKVMSRREGDLPMVRKMVEYPYPHGSVWISSNRVKGVKSRLRWSEGDTKEYMDQQNYNQAHFAEASGGGVGIWANSIETPETRILYAEAAKGHYYSAYYRYTADGTPITEHRYLGTEIRRQGVWYGHDIATVFGQVVYHDWTNDGVHGS